MPNKDTPRISLGNWITGGSLIYMPPTPKKEPAKPKPAPEKVATPKPHEAKKIESPPKAPTVVSEGTDSADDVLKKAMGIVAKAEAEKQKAEEEAKKMADAEAAKKAAEEDAAKKKAEEEAAAKKKEEDEAAAEKKAAGEEAAKEKALDAKIEELKAEKKRFQLEEEKKKLLHELAKDMLRGEQRALASRAVSEARFCSICGRRSHEGECNDASNEITRSSSSNSFPVVNVNVYGGSDDAVKVSNDKDVAITTKSTDEASKTDDKHKTDTKSDAKPVGNSNFTKEQDEKLLSLKADNKTWTYIGKELGINRNDCIKRHRELTGSVASKTSSSKESSLPEGHIDMGEITVMSAGIDDAFATKDDKSKDNDSEKNKKAGSNAGTNKSKGSSYKKPTVEDAGKKSDSQMKNGSKLTDNENPSSDSDNNNSDSSNATITQCQCPPPDPPYLPISFSATVPITGSRRVLVPDDTWTIKDLECLVELEFRHRKHKWMQLSADFWNITGRFIDPQIIEAKVMEAKFPEEEENADKEGEISEVSFKVKLDKTRPLDELELNISGDAWKLISEGGGGTTKIDD